MGLIILALAARVSILVPATAMALCQMGLANEVINLALWLLLGAIAVTVALAFGLGGREISFIARLPDLRRIRETISKFAS